MTWDAYLQKHKDFEDREPSNWNFERSGVWIPESSNRRNKNIDNDIELVRLEIQEWKKKLKTLTQLSQI